MCLCLKENPLDYFDMLPLYRTMKYKNPIWGYFYVWESRVDSVEKVKIVEHYLDGKKVRELERRDRYL